MFRILVTLALTTTITSAALQKRHYGSSEVASPSQIKFAIESKYDDTGPGAKTRESAYRTYKTLDDALIAYLDDPDTKLPEEERSRILKRLESQLLPPSKFFPTLQQPYISKPINPFTSQRHPISTSYVGLRKPIPTRELNYQVRNMLGETSVNSYTYRRAQSVRDRPVVLRKYPRVIEPSVIRGEIQSSYNDGYSVPKNTFSYGVNDRKTGDSQAAQDSRDGDSVRGFYSFIDPEGQTRTVHYTADDALGFRSVVNHS